MVTQRSPVWFQLGALPGNDFGQVVHIARVPLFTKQYRSKGGDALWLGRYPQALWKVMAAYHRVYDYVTCGLTAFSRNQLRALFRVWVTFTFLTKTIFKFWLIDWLSDERIYLTCKWLSVDGPSDCWRWLSVCPAGQLYWLVLRRDNARRRFTLTPARSTCTGDMTTWHKVKDSQSPGFTRRGEGILFRKVQSVESYSKTSTTSGDTQRRTDIIILKRFSHHKTMIKKNVSLNFAP